MARSDKGRPGVAKGYGPATAADIARYGVYGKGGAPKDAAAQSDAAEGSSFVGITADATRDRDVHEEKSGKAKRFPRKAAQKSKGPMPSAALASADGGSMSLASTDMLAAEERRELRRKAVLSAVILVVLIVPSLGIFGASTDGASGVYVVYSPFQVLQVLFDHVYNAVGEVTHLFSPKSTQIYDAPVWRPRYEDGVTPLFNNGEYVGWGVYNGVIVKAGIIGITLICAVLLSVSGMLYQNVFKNPIAGPGMLGVSSGVTLGMMILVYLYGAEAMGMLVPRYAMCYGFGAAILVFVILAGRKLSGKGKPFDIVTMLLVGSILSQLVGFVVTYVTLFVMEPDVYQDYITLSQMLVVDTSGISWSVLLVATVVSLAPVIYLRFRFNALAFDEQEVRMLGINFTMLRAVALICGAIMILAAQIHIGAVAMVSLIVPFLSRSWFGCEFRKQLVGNVCISTILLLVCRDIVDLIPFVGDGIGIGSAVSVVALPVFLLIMTRHMRGWE